MSEKSVEHECVQRMLEAATLGLSPLSVEWEREWQRVSPAARAAACQQVVIEALRVAAELVNSANAAHDLMLDARTVRLDSGAQALCMLAAVVLRLGRDADGEDEAEIRSLPEAP